MLGLEISTMRVSREREGSMRAVNISWFAAALLLGALIAVPSAWAGMDPECKADARDEYKDCKMLCKEVYRSDKDLCRNKDHLCAEACRAGRDFCLDGDPNDPNNPGPRVRLELCKDDCREDRREAKDQCKLDFPDPNDPELHQCIDGVVLDCFHCRQLCRGAEDYRVIFRNCRQINRYCINACPPAIVP